MSALSAAQRKANDKYIKEHYSQVKLSMPNAEAEALDTYCKAHGLTKAGFIRDAIKKRISPESIFIRLHKERSFQNWYCNTATDEEKQLCDNAVEYAEEYFSDFRFELESVVSDFVSMEDEAESGLDTFGAPFEIQYFDQVVMGSLIYKVEPLDENVVGQYEPGKHILTISPQYINDKPSILHELIHVFETVIDICPKYFHDILFYCIYRDLNGKIPDLHDRIVRHTHLYFGDEITREGGTHDILFFLKSLDLDLKCGYKLGTVCGYGRDIELNGKEVD